MRARTVILSGAKDLHQKKLAQKEILCCAQNNKFLQPNPPFSILYKTLPHFAIP